jgi:hypothetical protein
MQAFIAAASTLPLVTSAAESEWTNGRVVINIRAGYIPTEQTSQYDAETEAVNKQIDALAEEHGFGLDNAETDADGTETWYYRPNAA